MALYPNLFVYIDGVLLSENASIDTDLDRRSDPSFSYEDGYAGEDLGQAFRIVQASNFVPTPGAEYPFEDRFLAGAKVEVWLREPGEGQSCISVGRFTAVKRAAGTLQNYKLDWAFRGTATPFK